MSTLASYAVPGRVAGGVSARVAALLLLLALLPADGTGFLRVDILGYSVSLLDLVLVLLFFLDFLHRAVTGTEVVRFTRLMVTTAMVTSVMSVVSLLYVRFDRFSFDVKVTLNLIQLSVLIYLTGRILRDRELLRKALLAVLLGAAVMAGGTVLKSLGLPIPGAFRGSIYAFVGPFRLGVAGLTANGLPFTTMMLLAFPIVLTSAVVPRRWPRYSIALLLMLASLLSYSRGLWLGIAVELAVAGFSIFGRDGGVLRRTLAGVTMVAMVVAVGLGGSDLVDSVVAMRRRTVTQRLVGFTRSIDIANRGVVPLLFGSGKGYFYTSTDEGGVPHNLLLDLLVSKGILTLVLFLVLLLIVAGRLASLAVRTRDRPTRGFAVAFVAMLLGILAAGMAAPITTSMSFLFAVALAASFVAVVDREATASRQRERVEVLEVVEVATVAT